MKTKIVATVIAIAMVFNVGFANFVYADEEVTNTEKVESSVEKTKLEVKEKPELKDGDKLKEAKDTDKLKELKEKIKSNVKEAKEKIENRKEKIEQLQKMYANRVKMLEMKLKIFEKITEADKETKIAAVKTELEFYKNLLKDAKYKMSEEKNKLIEKAKEQYTPEEMSKINAAKEELKKNKELKVLNAENVFANGKNLKLDLPPVIKDGRTLIPVRAISEVYGFDVKWDAETKKITITKNDKTIEIFVDKNEAIVNGEKVVLDVPAKMYKTDNENARTVVPLRFIIEKMGLNVNWDEDTQTIDIDDSVPEVKEVELKEETVKVEEIDKELGESVEDMNKLNEEVKVLTEESEKVEQQ